MFKSIEWRVSETAKLNTANLSEPARLAALADLLDQEAKLIQKIDMLKLAASEENRKVQIDKLLNQVRSASTLYEHRVKILSLDECTMDAGDAEW